MCSTPGTGTGRRTARSAKGLVRELWLSPKPVRARISRDRVRNLVCNGQGILTETEEVLKLTPERLREVINQTTKEKTTKMIHARNDYQTRIQDSENKIPADEPVVFLLRARTGCRSDVAHVDRFQEKALKGVPDDKKNGANQGDQTGRGRKRIVRRLADEEGRRTCHDRQCLTNV